MSAGVAPAAWRSGAASTRTCTASAISALDSCFRERSFAWGPYLAEFEPGDGHSEDERRLIAAGEIRAVGFVYVGLA
jgi:hypothetical protein